MGYRNSGASHSHAYSLPKISEVGNMSRKLGVVLSYNVAQGFAFVSIRGFAGNSLLTQSEIARAGWTELQFGNFLVVDIEQTDRGARAVNPREAKYPEDWEQ